MSRQSERVTEHDARLLIPKKLAARCCGISVQAFSQWNLAPAKRQGREALFYLPDVFAEFARRRAPQLGEDELDPMQERARKDKESADKLAMENALRRGELADLNEVAEAWSGQLVSFRARMLAAPSKLAPVVNPENPNLARDVISAELERILDELADLDLDAEPGAGPETPAGASIDHQAAAPAHGEPVGRSVPDAQPRKQRRARKVEH